MAEGSIGGRPTPSTNDQGQIKPVAQDQTLTPRAVADKPTLSEAPETRAASIADTILEDSTRALQMKADSHSDLRYQVWDDEQSEHVGQPLTVESYIRALRNSLDTASVADLQEQANQRADAARRAVRPDSGTPSEAAYRLAVEADTLNQLAAEARAEKAGNPEPAPTVTLPENPELIAQLEAKLAEYRTRQVEAEQTLLESQDEGASAEAKITLDDSRGKIMVLQRLLERGGYSSLEMSKEIEESLGMPADDAHECVRVIRGYLQGGRLDGNQRLIGGTGLPEIADVSADISPETDLSIEAIGDLQSQRAEILTSLGLDSSSTEASDTSSQAWHQAEDAAYAREEARLKAMGIEGDELQKELEKFDDTIGEKNTLIQSIEARLQDAGQTLAAQFEAPEASLDPVEATPIEALPDEYDQRFDEPAADVSRALETAQNLEPADEAIDFYIEEDESVEPVDPALERARQEILPEAPAGSNEDGLPTLARMTGIGRHRQPATEASGFGRVTTHPTRRSAFLDRRLPQPTADFEASGPIISDDDADLGTARSEILPPSPIDDAADKLPSLARRRALRGPRPATYEATGFGQTRRVENQGPFFSESRFSPSQAVDADPETEFATGEVIDDELERAQAEIIPSGNLETLQARYNELQSTMQELMAKETEIMKGFGRLKRFLMKKLGSIPTELKAVQNQMQETMSIMEDMSGLIADMKREQEEELRAASNIKRELVASKPGSAEQSRLQGELEAREGKETISMMEAEREDILRFFGLDQDPDTLQDADVYGQKLAGVMTRMGNDYESLLRKDAGLKPSDPLPADLNQEMNNYDKMLVERYNRLAALEAKIRTAEEARRPEAGVEEDPELTELEEARQGAFRQSATQRARDRRDRKQRVSVMGASYDV